MKELVLITGAGGMLAKRLTLYLEPEYSVRFLTRGSTRNNLFQWDVNRNYIHPEAFTGVKHIIHLAGTPINSKRWTAKQKELILSSRVDSANLIQEELIKRNISIDTYISASAIGYYGSKTTDEIFTEESPNGTDFLSEVCYKWEGAAKLFGLKEMAKNTAILRLGVVLSADGGLLKKLMIPVKYYLGAVPGSGNQYMPWIHSNDLCSMIKFVLDNGVSGVFNAVAPEHITQAVFTKTIAKSLQRPIILPNIPKGIIRLLFGEMSAIILEGSRVSSDKIRNYGFNFTYSTLHEAINELLKGK